MEQWKARTPDADLSLQLSHCGREVEHQPGDVLQLVLQHLDGICLLLVLERTTRRWSAVVRRPTLPFPCDAMSLFAQTHLLLGDAGGVL